MSVQYYITTCLAPLNEPHTGDAPFSVVQSPLANPTTADVPNLDSLALRLIIRNNL